MSLPCRFLLIIILLSVVVGTSCTNDMEVVSKIIDPAEEPDLAATNIEVLYSDSARLQVKLKAPHMKQFAEAQEPRREFPDGLHVWFYEKTGELKAEISANWAQQDITTEIWETRSNVVLTNSEGQKLETEQLFWDRKKAIVYTEKYTKITQKSGTVGTGDSFFAKQDFSEWKLTKGKATIFLEDEDEKQKQ